MNEANDSTQHINDEVAKREFPMSNKPNRIASNVILPA